MVDTSKIKYLKKSPGTEFLRAANNAPSGLMCIAGSGEIFLEGLVHKVRWITNKSAASQFGLDLSQASGNPGSVLRIDYEGWAMPAQFDPSDPENLICRREHIYVHRDVLLEANVSRYGLGPEFGFLHWQDDVEYETNIKKSAISDVAIQVLCEEVRSRYASRIVEYLEEEPMPKGLCKSMRDVYRQVVKESNDRLREHRALQARISKVQSVKDIHFDLSNAKTSRVGTQAHLLVNAVGTPFFLVAMFDEEAGGATAPSLRFIRATIARPTGIYFTPLSKATIPFQVPQSTESDETLLLEALQDGRIIQALIDSESMKLKSKQT